MLLGLTNNKPGIANMTDMGIGGLNGHICQEAVGRDAINTCVVLATKIDSTIQHDNIPRPSEYFEESRERRSSVQAHLKHAC